MNQDLLCIETLGESMRRTVAQESLFWESAIPSGIGELDAQTGGLRPGELTLLASEDAFITSKIAQKFIESVAIVQKLPVIVICAGSGLREFCGQLIRGGDSKNRQWGRSPRNIAEPDWENLKRLTEAPIYVTQPIPSAGIDFIDQEIEKLVGVLGNVGLIVIEGIEHLNIWANPEYRSENPGASWAAVSAKAKWMALMHRCPVILDARVVNNCPETGHLANPTVIDLPYQGALANSADIAYFFEKFSYMKQGRAFQLRTAFSRNGLYALMDLFHNEETDQIVEASWQR